MLLSSMQWSVSSLIFLILANARALELNEDSVNIHKYYYNLWSKEFIYLCKETLQRCVSNSIFVARLSILSYTKTWKTCCCFFFCFPLPYWLSSPVKRKKNVNDLYELEYSLPSKNPLNKLFYSCLNKLNNLHWFLLSSQFSFKNASIPNFHPSKYKIVDYIVLISVLLAFCKIFLPYLPAYKMTP